MLGSNTTGTPNPIRATSALTKLSLESKTPARVRPYLSSGSLSSSSLTLEPTGAWGAATEVSRGKDTPSGHWELLGVPVPWEWGTFPATVPAFPDDVVAEVCRLAGTDGILGNRHAPGTAIIDEEGEAHLRTGWPICYTSVDSVLQIAAHTAQVP